MKQPAKGKERPGKTKSMTARATTLAQGRTSYRHLLSAETRAELERREGRR